MLKLSHKVALLPDFIYKAVCLHSIDMTYSHGCGKSSYCGKADRDISDPHMYEPTFKQAYQSGKGPAAYMQMPNIPAYQPKNNLIL